ncbi:MAG: hypothetical protein ACRDQU_09930 [Pseudonocardiaceae bacterium]
MEGEAERWPLARELFPRRICLRVSAKSHVSMVLGDQAFERGAWANRITEAEAGVGYVFGETRSRSPTDPSLVTTTRR